MTGAVNPEMITVARESRGMNQEQLAKAMEVSQSKLSKYENGMLAVSDDDASALSAVLGYTPDLFVQDSDQLGAGSVCIHHENPASVPVSKLRQFMHNCGSLDCKLIGFSTAWTSKRRLNFMEWTWINSEAPKRSHKRPADSGKSRTVRSGM